MFNIYLTMTFYNIRKLTIDMTFFRTLGFIELTILALYFVCKCISDLIQLSIQKEAKVKELLDSLDNMFSVIKENTSSLNADINKCNEDIWILKNISNTMAGEAIAKQVLENFANISQKHAAATEEMLTTT
jgi:methyl-accepting chemotaxis protein